MKEYLNILRNTTLFGGIDDGDILKMCSCLGCHVRDYGRDETIWLTGDRVESGGVVLRGSVRAERIDYSGKRSIIAMHGTGAVFGDVLMSTPEAKSPVDVISADDTKVMFIPFGKLMSGCENCCEGHDRVRINLIGEIGIKFWNLNQKLIYMSKRSLRSKVASYLLDSMSGTREGSSFSAGCSREEMADFLSVNRSALSRELGAMRREGLIEFYRDTFKIKDLERLKGEA